MEPAGITQKAPLQRAATAPTAKRKGSADVDYEASRIAAAASIRPGWDRQEYKRWVPIEHKPKISHLTIAARERAAALGMDLKCSTWRVENYIDWLEKTSLPTGWSHSLTPTTPLGNSGSGAKNRKKMNELGPNRNSDDGTARTLDMNGTAASSPTPLLDLDIFAASRTAEAASRGATQDGNPGEEEEEVVEEEEEDEEDGSKEPKAKKKKVRWNAAWYDAYLHIVTSTRASLIRTTRASHS